jgi:DNA sulfur modification protein DndD
MWLSRVELKNFKSYRQQVFEFPQPQAGKNLVLIGGVNGYGKTTLLEAIYVGLYGEEAIKHKALDSAGLKTKSYGHFLETAFHRLAPAEGQERMEVSVEFSREDEGALRITRRWFFNSKGKYNDQKVVVETRTKIGGWIPRAEGILPELLESYATPPWLASFFFFDGEKIAGLADEDRTGWIQSGLENLLGVGLVKGLREQLTNYIDKKLREVGGVDEQRIEELKHDLAACRT